MNCFLKCIKFNNWMLVLLIININTFAFNVYESNNKCCCSNYALNNKYLKLNQKITPETTIFAFDLHDVLFYKKYKNIAYSAFKALKNGMFWYVFNPVFLFKAVSLSMKNKIWEDIYYTLCQDYPDLLKFEKDFFDISNSCCIPDNPVLDIVKQLKERKYKLFLLSNIGYNSYIDLRKRFEKELSFFDGVYLPCKDNNYHHKPLMQYYKGFIEYLDHIGLQNKQIMFIDDLAKNLDGALHLGISGILFENTKKLRCILTDLSVI